MTTHATPTDDRRGKLDDNDLVIRPVRAADRPAVEAIAAQVWEGHDYLPFVFDAWLAEKEGIFCAAVLHDRLVGTAKLTRLSDDQWWMEGLRVDPAFREQGIARALHHYLVNYARRFAPGTLRFSTASGNAAVVRLAAETGFRQAAVFAPYGAPAEAVSAEGLIELQPDDLSRVLAFLESAPHITDTLHTVEMHWRFLPLTPALLRRRLAAGLVMAWQPEEAVISGLVIINAPDDPKADDEDSRLYIGYMDAAPGQLVPVARALRGLAYRQGHAHVSSKVPRRETMLAALHAAGYARRWDMDVLLFEHQLA